MVETLCKIVYGEWKAKIKALHLNGEDTYPLKVGYEAKEMPQKGSCSSENLQSELRRGNQRKH